VNEETLAHWGDAVPKTKLKSKPSFIFLLGIINILNKHKFLLSVVNVAEGIHAF